MTDKKREQAERWLTHLEGQLKVWQAEGNELAVEVAKGKIELLRWMLK